MANFWFEFKQFIVRQDKCAMKVGTDGVLLGSWANVSGVNRILDVGTGTGLLALMLAQRSVSGLIDAIDIEVNAVLQAKENVTNSPFKEQIRVFHSAFQDFSKDNLCQYDLIVSNPPYFKNSYQSKSRARNIARHTGSLSYEDLLSCAYKYLSVNGSFAVIIPSQELEGFLKISNKLGFFLGRMLDVYPTLKKPSKRVLLSLEKCEPTSVIKEKLVIEPEERHQYSEEYVDLLKDFYMKF